MEDIRKEQRKAIFKVIRELFENMTGAYREQTREEAFNKIRGVIYAAAMCNIISGNTQTTLYKLTRMKYQECKEGGKA